MSDETVRVPAALVEALREELEKGFAEWGTRGEPGSLSWLSWNVVDAAERPAAGEGYPAAPVGEPLCKCGHNNRLHRNDGRDGEWTPCVWADGMDLCDCERFTPAPLSSPRRTRDEGSEDEADTIRRERDELWEDRNAADIRIIELEYVAKRQSEMFQDVVTERDRLAVNEAKLEAERDAARLQVEALNIVVGDRLNTARLQGKAEGLREAADGLEGALGVPGMPQTLHDFRIWLCDRAARLAGEDDR